MHTNTFRVRYYECDAYGHLNNAVYLRYMQEAAFDASAAAGWPLERYEARGEIWLITDTTVEYLKPVVYGDTITVRTWVSEMSRIRSLRSYAMYRGEELVARGVSDWAYLDIEQQRPIRIPSEVRDSFPSEGEPVKRTRFPDAPEPPPGAFLYRRPVEWMDIDPQQHVNNAAYLAYTEEASKQAVASFGYPLRRLLDEGIAFVLGKQRISYERPALPDDVIVVRTFLSGLRRATGLRHFTIQREDGTRLARAYNRWACVNLETGRPIRMPPEILDAFAEHIAPG